MRVVNCKYIDANSLKDFIITNDIPDTDKVLLQIFTGICDRDYISRLLDEIKDLLPHINIIGTTTHGEIMGSEIYERSTILSFSIFEETNIKVFAVNSMESSYAEALSLIDKIEDINKAKVGIMFADGLGVNGEEFLKAFDEKAPSLIISGGLAGDNAEFVKTYVFTKDNIDASAVIAVLYNPNLIVNTEISLGWKAVGKTFTVTKAIGNRVYTIDDMGAQDLYGKYLGERTKRALPISGIEFPLIIKRGDNQIIRSVKGKEGDGSLKFAGNIKTGDRVTFGYGNIDFIVNNIESVYSEITQKPIEAIFVYSCMARKKLLGKNIQAEIMPLSKSANVSGFFTYGEFFNYSKSNENKKELLNNTMTILSLSENGNKKANEAFESPKGFDSLQSIEALSNLVEISTQELNELNESLNEQIKQAVEEAKEKDRQLMQQSRFAQMGEMLSMIAHQWRQPLSAISATSSTIVMKSKLHNLSDTVAMDLASKISSYSKKLSKTIDEFKDFFVEDDRKKFINIDELIYKVLNVVEVSIASKDIEIIKEIDTKDELYTYTRELEQAILNLIKNSEDILIERQIKNPHIKIKSYNIDNTAIIQISDNAGGIDEEIMDKIFDPYFSTKTEKNGTGLGLYMSKVIIEDHCNGKLSVYNGDDGAVFVVEIATKEI